MDFAISKFRGAYAIKGNVAEEIVNAIRISNPREWDDAMRSIKPLEQCDCPHHITFCSKVEAASLSEASVRAIKRMILTASDIITYGMHLNRAKHNAFIKIVWNKGNLMRIKHGLEPKDFHITLSALHLNDNEVSHEITIQEVLTRSLTERQADHLLYHVLHIKEDHAGAMLLLETWMQEEKFASSAKLMYRLAECLFESQRYKACALACLRVLSEFIATSEEVPVDTVYSRAVKILRKCAMRTQISLVMTHAEHAELQEINDHVRHLLYKSDFTSHKLVEFTNTNSLPHLDNANHLVRSHQTLPNVPQSLARYFTWIVPGFLAGMSIPRHQADIDLLAKVGLKSVITLTEESPLNADWFKDEEIDNIFMPVKNMEAPTVQQVDYFIRVCQGHWKAYNHRAILAHCGGSKGRLGTVLACYIALWKTCLPNDDEYPLPVMPAAEAIAWIRQLRPGSIESASQEAFVGQWIKHRWQQKDKRVPEPQCESLMIQGTPKFHPDRSRVIVLVGASGSGKSSWSSIFKKNWKNTCVINQDALGSKEACLAKFKEYLKKPNITIIVDRCNVRVADRKEWIIPSHETIAVEFQYTAELCKQRVAERHDHETIRPGSGRRIVDSQFGQYEKVNTSEGFNQIYQVRSIHATEQSIDKLLESMHVFNKFPRTKHIVNLGSATGDDLVLSEKEVDNLMSKYDSSQIICEEKVDGANLGISLSGFDLNLLSQNRGHYINHQTHSQFKKLDDWLDQHRGDLLRILLTDREYPCRYILFGEWLASIHSIAYTKLPDYFIAFDIWDRYHEHFLSRRNVEDRLKNTSISQVPKLDINMTSELLKDTSAIKLLLQQESAYTDGAIEGIYFRFSDEDQIDTCRNVLKILKDKQKQCELIKDNKTQSLMKQILQLQWEKSLDELADDSQYKFIRIRCYNCRKQIMKVHKEYRLMCEECGEQNQQKISADHDLTGKIALVTGARIKIGFWTSVMLLRNKATVIATTRFDQDALKRYQECQDYSVWQDRLIILRADFSSYDDVSRLVRTIKQSINHIDILINNAAQTIERPEYYYRNLKDNERNNSSLITDVTSSDDQVTFQKYFPDDLVSLDGEPLDLRENTSWTKTIHEISYRELSSVMSINFLVPYILVKELYEWMKTDRSRPSFVVNVSSREGVHHFRKGRTHVHTNAAKASLNMMTETIHREYAKDHIYVNTVDPGWVSTLTPHSKFQDVPLTIKDGAARILDPIYLGLKGVLNSGAYFRCYKKSEWRNYETECDDDAKNMIP